MKHLRLWLHLALLVTPLLLSIGCTTPTDGAKEPAEVSSQDYLAKALVIKTEILMLCSKTHEVLDPIASQPDASSDLADAKDKTDKIVADLAAQEAKLMEIPAGKSAIALRDALRTQASSAREACKSLAGVIEVRTKLAELESSGDPNDRATQARLSEYRAAGPDIAIRMSRSLKAMDEARAAVDATEESLRNGS